MRSFPLAQPRHAWKLNPLSELGPLDISLKTRSTQIGCADLERVHVPNREPGIALRMANLQTRRSLVINVTPAAMNHSA